MRNGKTTSIRSSRHKGNYKLGNILRFRISLVKSWNEERRIRLDKTEITYKDTEHLGGCIVGMLLSNSRFLQPIKHILKSSRCAIWKMNEFLNIAFTCPCIAIIFAAYNQQNATFHNLFISVRRSTCFRSFFFSVRHHELKTAHTASGICQTKTAT